MKRLAVIPARGGSKRIPKKNIREFCGKPIIAYSILAAKESGCFESVMVSTDSAEIAEVAKRFGADLPFQRSSENANDTSTISDVLKEVLSDYEDKGEHIEEACCLFPTAPFVTAERIREAFSILEKSAEIDTVMPVVRFSYPPQRGLLIQNGSLVMQYPEHGKTRSQDLPAVYHDAGQFLCFRAEPFKKTGDVMRTRLAPLILPELEVQDIDDEMDWKLAEQKFRMLHNLL